MKRRSEGTESNTPIEPRANSSIELGLTKALKARTEFLSLSYGEDCTKGHMFQHSISLPTKPPGLKVNQGALLVEKSLSQSSRWT